MSSKVASKKKQASKELEYVKGYRIPDYVSYLFLAVMFGVYPIIMDDNYFNITITRYHTFIYSAGVFIVLMIIAYIAESALESYYEGKSLFTLVDKCRCYNRPDFWMISFIMANTFAWMVADDQKNALSGQSGRYMGLFMFIIVAMMFLLMANRFKTNMLVFMILAASSAFAYIVAIYQHAGNDFMKYKDRISAKQYDIFISTMGNINIFASFLVITVAVFFAMFVFGDKLVYRVIAGVLLFGGGFVIMIANSDSAYLGIGATAVLLFFLAYKEGYVRRYIGALFLIASGNLGVVLQNRYITSVLKMEYDKRGGVAEALDRIDLAVAILAVTAVIYVIVHVCSKVFRDKLEKLNKKKVIIILLCSMAAGAIAVVIMGIKSGASLFTFNYKWGTYRGYIWTKCVELFKDAPMVNKLFGYGNESLKGLMNSNFRDEMLKVTGKVYDNAHNEVLQYLVTTGIVGAVSYIGLFVSSFVYMIKNAAKNPVVNISLAVITGYFVQGLINLNQPITTPFYFVFMALGIGCIRYQKRVREYDE